MNVQSIFGTRYKCKNVPNLDFCFKCYWHREDLVEDWEISGFEFEIIGPAIDNAPFANNEYSTSSESSDDDWLYNT